MLPRRFLEKVWNPLSQSRRGQCLGILLVGAIVGVCSSIEWTRLPVGQRLVYGLLGGVWAGCIAILVLVVPGIYLEFIRARESRGQYMVVHRFLLGLYFFPFVTAVFLGSIIYFVDRLPR